MDKSTYKELAIAILDLQDEFGFSSELAIKLEDVLLKILVSEEND